MKDKNGNKIEVGKRVRWGALIRPVVKLNKTTVVLPYGISIMPSHLEVLGDWE